MIDTGLMNEEKIITIDLGQIGLLKQSGKDLTLTQDAEAELRKVLEFKKLAEDLYDFVQAKLGEVMSQQDIKKIVSGNIVVRYSTYGERYQVGEETPEEYTKSVSYIKANPETIDKYVDENGELPKGVKLKERTAKASISFRNEE